MTSSMHCFRAIHSFFAAWPSKVCNDRSVVTSQVHHVICLHIRTIHSASRVNSHMVYLLLISPGRSESCLFAKSLCERCIERRTSLHPSSPFVSFAQCMFPHTHTFYSLARPCLRIEVPSSFCRLFPAAAMLNPLGNLLSMNVSTSSVREVFTCSYNLLLLQFYRRDEHPLIKENV